MPFTGQAEATIDAKQRLAIPAKFRNRWSPEQDGQTWFCVPWPETGALRLYTEKMHNDLFTAGRRDPSLTPDEDQAELDVILHSVTEQVDVDSNNRIRLPAWQVEALKLPKEVVVLGAGDRLEIRARDEWQNEFNDRLSKMAQLSKTLSARKPTN
ncbi:MAG: division/cell wall cluster transcriptional repressor MraZ [Phycisphaerales bacterium JB052]